MYKPLVISYLIVLIYVIYLPESETTSKTYGEFGLKIVRFDICKGPKRDNCTDFTAKVTNETNLVVDIVVKRDVIPNHGKILSLANGQPLVRLQMKKPCDHLYMKPLFQQMFNVSQNCQFKKGHYVLDFDIENTAKKYYGGMFLYGNLTFKSLFYNDECNFSCTVAEVTFYPKKH